MSRLREPIGPTDHVVGRPDAPVALVEAGDYQCPYCARAHYEMVEVLRRVGHELRYAFRHFPLTRVHPHALLAAQAAEAAGVQGRFWPMHSMLFENQSDLSARALGLYAETLGLDMVRFARELRDGVHLAKVQNDFQSGVRSGVTGTPTFFLDGIRVDHGWDADSLVVSIEAAVARERRTSPAAVPSPAHR